MGVMIPLCFTSWSIFYPFNFNYIELMTCMSQLVLLCFFFFFFNLFRRNHGAAAGNALRRPRRCLLCTWYVPRPRHASAHHTTRTPVDRELVIGLELPRMWRRRVTLPHVLLLSLHRTRFPPIPIQPSLILNSPKAHHPPFNPVQASDTPVSPPPRARHREQPEARYPAR